MRYHRILLLIAALALSLGACDKEKAGAPAQVVNTGVAVNASGTNARSMEERLAAGGKLYAAHCAACHQANGQGLTGAFPPLAGSDYLASGGPAVAVDVVLNGLKGPITVNGREYNSVMPNLSYLNDDNVADIVTFVLNSWGNSGGEVSSAEVAAVRAGNAGREIP